MAREVDRLLRKLPGADPSLISGPRVAAGQPVTGPRPATAASRESPSPARARPEPTPLAIWGLATLGAALGIALPAWPYAHDCGFSLYGYLAAVFVVLVVAGWTAIAAWRRRMAAAHVAALVLAFWGIVLAAEQVLPRIGYAADAAHWRCRAEPSVTPGGRTPGAAPIPGAPDPGPSPSPSGP